MIENLPTLVIELIAYHNGLNYNDLINLRSTNRKLRSLLSLKKSKKLNLFIQNYPSDKHLLYTNERINYQNTLRCENANRILNSLEFRTRFNHIQQLSIYHQPYSDNNMSTNANLVVINLDHLNFYENLEHLEVKCVRKLEGKKLSLRNLKICSLEIEETSEFDMNTPNIKALKFSMPSFPKLINNTDELIYLAIRDEIDFDYLEDLFKKSKNLSIVAISSLATLLYILGFINFYTHSYEVESLMELRLEEFDCISFEWRFLKKLFVDLKKFKESPLTEHIQLFFNDTPIDLPELKGLSSILYSQNNHTGFANLFKTAKLKTNDFIELIEKHPVLEFIYPTIQELELNNSIKLDEHLIYKLRNLRGLEIEKGFKFDNDGILFKLILETWSKLETLVLDNVNLTQDQLDQIPNYFQNLRNFTMLNGSKAKNLDFSYLNKFKNLKFINVDFNLKKNDLISVFKNCPSLIKIQFTKASKESTISVDKKRQVFNIKVRKLSKREIKRKKYDLDEEEGDENDPYESNRMHKFINFDSLIEHYTTLIS